MRMMAIVLENHERMGFSRNKSQTPIIKTKLDIKIIIRYS